MEFKNIPGVVSHIVAIMRFSVNAPQDYNAYINSILNAAPKLVNEDNESTIQINFEKELKFNDQIGDTYILVVHGDVRGMCKKELRYKYDEYLKYLSHGFGGGFTIISKASTIIDNDRTKSRH